MESLSTDHLNLQLMQTAPVVEVGDGLPVEVEVTSETGNFTKTTTNSKNITTEELLTPEGGINLP